MARTAKVEIIRTRNGQDRWRLRAANGEIVATGESHHGGPNRAKRAWYAVERIARTAPPIVIVKARRTR